MRKRLHILCVCVGVLFLIVNKGLVNLRRDVLNMGHDVRKVVHLDITMCVSCFNVQLVLLNVFCILQQFLLVILSIYNCFAIAK